MYKPKSRASAPFCGSGNRYAENSEPLGVGDGVNVGVGVVPPGVALGVGVGVLVGVTEGVCVGVGVGVGDGGVPKHIVTPATISFLDTPE
jgi:hypothetical protein